ncbi:uncharacterized protein HD556DRAFT_1312835 [Suillus plorans]|uniref:CHAT domain-containing protein n=1 Tax=Suillus plorans TaxID=116603 RepID=A0A9P7AFH6_9AGAM|nr:uncharacterized protein HD556DRAFT_1312835 [Suillus plorans]KAG1787378.1 hypothetical protein HD556DRAFT_1312835 [Suillus plorans]
MNPGESRTDLIVLLQMIWDQNMLRIVNVLEHVLKLKRRSRIWLCPTAAFTLHAAHPFQTKADRSVKEPCLEDLYICSYMPTLLALIRSRQLMKKRVPPSFVAIGQGQPSAGKGKVLLAVDSELELTHKLVLATANHTTISGDKVTRASALEAEYAEFAFLSACHTAVGEEMPDEVIHLAAGIQFSGFKNVVGTLWEVDDAVAKDVVEAWALKRATHAVKTKVPLEQRMIELVVLVHRGHAMDPRLCKTQTGPEGKINFVSLGDRTLAR